jgi:hypothetical protein
MEPVKLRYSETLIRRAIGAFWFRVTGWRYFIAVALVLISFICSLAAGDRSWKIGISASILCLGVIFGVALYFVHYRASITKFRAMKRPEATFELGEEGFRIISDAGMSELAWSNIIEVWRFPDFWLLFFSRAQFLTFPLDEVDADTREFILGKIKSHDGKVS